MSQGADRMQTEGCNAERHALRGVRRLSEQDVKLNAARLASHGAIQRLRARCTRERGEASRFRECGSRTRPSGRAFWEVSMGWKLHLKGRVHG
jgi:hypothetical protein